MAQRKLRELVNKVDYVASQRLDGIEVASVTSDSRKVAPGSLFVALEGLHVDGHDYVADAVAKGCAALVVRSGRCPEPRRATPPCIEVEDTREALGLIAASFWRQPAREMTLIGITGTNGKTTTAYLLETLIKEGGGNPGVIGTVNYRYNDKEYPAPFTTPGPEALHSLLRDMADHQVTHVIMEVSSHALEQRRLAGIRFDVALFTNLSRDHLDFHGDMEHYFASKKRLFADHLKPEGKAIVLAPVASDHHGPRWGERLRQELVDHGTTVVSCGLEQGSVRAERVAEGLQGLDAVLHLPSGPAHLRSGLVGRFNLLNLLGAAGVGVALGYDAKIIGQGLSGPTAAPGRLERVPSRTGTEVFVDYAHTPDALENVLKTLRELGPGRLIVIFGCGGDRDSGKRSLMGEIAGRHADVIVLTSDNPRTEQPLKILRDIEQGLIALGTPRMRLGAMLRRRGLKGYDVIPSRKEAIRETLYFAGQGDIVLISGKGHETYQILGSRRIFFDDRLAAREQSLVERW